MFHDLGFIVSDYVFLCVSPTKGVLWFANRSKYNPMYIGPFGILQAIGDVAYDLTPPQIYQLFT